MNMMLKVACPRCGSPIGVGCTPPEPGMDGIAFFHRERMVVAQATDPAAFDQETQQNLDRAEFEAIETLQGLARRLEAEAGPDRAREAFAVRWAILTVNGVAQLATDDLIRKYGEKS